MLRPELWKRFVDQFREMPDGDENGWRGEYWGKLLRGGVLTYTVTKNQEFYNILTDTVRDMLTTADSDGRISTYKREREFSGWDVWSRRHVLVGMQSFLEICEDGELKDKIIESMRRQADYLIKHIGKKEEGKLPITQTSNVFQGINSCTVLDPIVKLYSITGEKRYLDFADYIISTGCLESADIFDLAYKDELPPHLYPITKANETVSCFVGAIEYYRVTGNEYYKTAAIRFTDRILAGDFTVIGSAGCTHELFDHSTVRQANTTNGEIMQETCVTVTIMELMYQLYVLTGEAKYADAFECSFYNALLGSLNTENIISKKFAEKKPKISHEPLPFDSYSPLTAGTRGSTVAGFQKMSDGSYYGCCVCIGAIGMGIAPMLELTSTEHGFALNLFLNGSIDTVLPSGNKIRFNIKTDYPKSGKIEIYPELDIPEHFELLIRNPAWSKQTKVCINGNDQTPKSNYISLEKTWKSGDCVEILFDMTVEALYPISYGEQILMNNWIDGTNYMTLTYDKEDPLAKKHIALRRGPVMLAQDERLGYSLDAPVSIAVSKDGTVDAKINETSQASYKSIVEVKAPLTNGKSIILTDYASSGKCYDTTARVAVWILTT